jgi:hypothetical protein
MTSHVEAASRGYLVGHKHELLFVNGRGRPYSRNKIVQTILHQRSMLLVSEAEWELLDAGRKLAQVQATLTCDLRLMHGQ